jgi:hypothetical protein
MIETRPLTREELSLILKDAPKSETVNLNRLVKNPFEFFKDNSVNQEGIIINGRPIYFWAITFNNKKNRYEIWTVVNNDVKEQFSLYKIAKKKAIEWSKKYKEIYATMEKFNEKNIEWTKRIGFIPIQDDNNIITLKMGGI